MDNGRENEEPHQSRKRKMACIGEGGAFRPLPPPSDTITDNSEGDASKRMRLTGPVVWAAESQAATLRMQAEKEVEGMRVQAAQEAEEIARQNDAITPWSDIE